ncbi:hypothetical protein HTZ84_06950 [Haloterrigena sp. SYSU A558-1]|uniref:Uncharacterized protein n=1 Tax=Haloterrigena gelatinilytica TaxID=2741724 RepID=A0A8J8GPL1_9EURY|nr:hypothetical protein [Haloterrigena gelatinilytica]NUB92124.1 hypothetical protein [Haloterrigena gelatinilytica]NUC72046.1 hypothetical protein [Haloterrigena gelatinilytica]
MDPRLIVTVPVLTYYVIMGLFALAQSSVGATFTQGQPAFLLVVGVVGPLVALGLIWLRNYIYGAPLLVGALLPTAWFVCYFFFVHENPANVFAVGGEGSTAYLVATFGIVATSLIAAGVSCWLWYQVSPQFRTAVDRFIRPEAAE